MAVLTMKAPAKTSAIRIIRRLMAPHIAIYSGLCLLALLVAFLELAFMTLLFPFLTLLLPSSSSQQFSPKLNTLLNWTHLFIPSWSLMTSLVVLLLGVTFLKFILTLAYDYLTGYGSAITQHTLKMNLMNQFSRLPYSYFLDHKHGELVYATLLATSRTSGLLLKIPGLFIDLLRAGAIVVFIVAMSPRTALALILLGGTIYFITAFISRRVSYVLGKDRVRASGDQSNLLNEFLLGIKHMKVFGQSDRWIGLFENASQRYNALYVRDNVWLTAPKTVVEFVVFSSAFIYVLATYSGAAEASSQIALLGVVGMGLVKILPFLNGIGRAQIEIVGCLADAQTVLDMLDVPPSLEWTGRQPLRGFEHGIRLESVTFSHADRGKVIDKLSCTFEKNRTTAIVGKSGAGKTTLINLLLGLYAPNEGKISIDGVDLATLDIQTWRQRIGLVSQEAFIFHASLYDNITLGDTRFSRDQVEQAAQQAQIQSFIDDLPKGYETLLGEHGMKLSGGQQQRIALARALLRKPDLLLLDEATSHLDNISERLIQETIAALASHYTLIVVAHRISTIASADKILVLDQGRVVEEGRHLELIERGQLYKDLVKATPVLS
jgi:subfamily B ATP-binding cassette protein MsbA